MDDNEYLLQYLIRERLREAEARGAFHSMLRHARPSRFGLWWRLTVARAAHLSLPKLGIRL